MSWTDERVEELKKLWTEGLTASQIAAKLGGVSRNAVIGKVHRLKLESRGKPTRAARPAGEKLAAARPATATAARSVGSGAGSVGLSGGGIGVGGASARGPGRTVTTVTHSVGATVMRSEIETDDLAEMDTRPIEEVVVPIARRLKLVDISERTCKFPYGDPLSEDFHFCGHDVKEGAPYCTYHAKVVYQSPNDRKRRR